MTLFLLILFTGVLALLTFVLLSASIQTMSRTVTNDWVRALKWVVVVVVLALVALAVIDRLPL